MVGAARRAPIWRSPTAVTLELLARIDNLIDTRYAGSVIVNEANGRFFETAAPRNGLLSLRWLQKF